MDKQFINKRERLQNELNKIGCNKDNLKLIVLTHGDNDHACNAAYFKEYYHTKIAMHTGDKRLTEEPDLSEWMKSFNYRSLIFKLAFLFMSKAIKKH